MLHKCANQSCSNRFLRLTSGKLFQVELDASVPSRANGAGDLAPRKRPARRIEHFWLCDVCCEALTLTYDKDRGVTAIPLPDPAKKKPSTVVRTSAVEADVCRWERKKTRSMIEG